MRDNPTTYAFLYIPIGTKLQGDGESIPDTATEGSDDQISKSKAKSSREEEEEVPASNPCQVQISVDLLAFALFLVGAGTRMYKLDLPRNVV